MLSFISCIFTIYAALYLLENTSFIMKKNIWKRNPVLIQKQTCCWIKRTVLLSPSEDDDNDSDSSKEFEYIFMPENETYYQDNPENSRKPVYHLFWKDCKDCQELIEEMEKRGMNVYFINGNEIFNDNILEGPLLYKDDNCIEGLFAIYAEVFRM